MLYSHNGVTWSHFEERFNSYSLSEKKKRWKGNYMVWNFCNRKVGINYTQLFIFTKGNTGSIKIIRTGWWSMESKILDVYSMY